MSNTKVKRFMKNVKTNVVFPWAEAPMKKINMVECDEEGNILVEHISVADGDMIRVMEELVEDKRVLVEKVSRLEKEVNMYKATWGPLESKLPEAKKPKAKKDENEAAKAIPTKDELVKALAEEHGIKVNKKNHTLDELIGMKAKADEEANKELNNLLG